MEFHERNIALFTRRSVKLSVVDEKIYKFEIATPSIVSYEVEEDGYFAGLATRTEPDQECNELRSIKLSTCRYSRTETETHGSLESLYQLYELEVKLKHYKPSMAAG